MAELTPDRIDKLRQALLERREALRREIVGHLEQSDQQHYIDLAGEVRDIGDASVGDLLADLNLAVIDQEVNEIRRIERALERIREGSYGRCIDCGVEIDLPRLEAEPAAERCVDCQRRYEQTHAPAERPSL